MKLKLFFLAAVSIVAFAATSPAASPSAADEQPELRCRRLQRAVQSVIAAKGFESAKTGEQVRPARKPRSVMRELVGFSGRQSSVGRGCMRCITQQVKRRVPLSEQTACGLHDPCVTGDPLDVSMGACIESICASDASCCRKNWHDGCVAKVATVCGDPCEACSHDVCEAGAILQPTCGSCAAAVCDVDPFCCDTLWSAECAAKVPSICNLSCTPPSTTTSTTSTTVLLPIGTTSTTLDDEAISITTTSTTTSTLVPVANDDCLDVVEFEDDPAGTISSRALTSSGRPVVIRATNPKLGANVNAALVFDSTCDGVGRCAGGDSDLGAPNADFGGPGIGAGGRKNQPYANTAALGNILIVGEDLRDTDGDGIIDDPDDQAGVVVMQEFDFSAFAPATVHALTVVDVENAERPAKIEAFDAAGASIGSFPIPATGDNGVATIDLGGVSDVWKLIVTLRGSSAIAEIALGCGDGGGTTTTTTTTTSSTSSTTTTTLPLGESLSCPVTFTLGNATTAFALQFEVDHANALGGFPDSPCTVSPEGFADFNTEGATLEIGWADSTGSGFSGPGTFANCTFISTGGQPSGEDFKVAILDCSGPNPPEPCDPAPMIHAQVESCTSIAAVCGNDVREQGEGCDDGNVADGDGCSATCSTEGGPTTTSTSSTTTSTTTTTVPTTSSTTTTTLAPTTTTTTSSTTTTTLAQSFGFDCTLTVRVTSSELLGSLKYSIDYASVSGNFLGSGLGASCTNLVTSASKSFFDDENARILRESLISVGGFRGPLDVATCIFETNDDKLAASAFGLTVQEGTTPPPDIQLLNPTVTISSVACATKPGSSGVTERYAPPTWPQEPVGKVF
jgi:cysteine-rich repeat protein